MRNPDGAISQFIAVMQDVSERWDAEDALFNAEKILKDVQSMAPMGSWELIGGPASFAGPPVFFAFLTGFLPPARQPFSQILDADSRLRITNASKRR